MQLPTVFGRVWVMASLHVGVPPGGVRQSGSPVHMMVADGTHRPVDSIHISEMSHAARPASGPQSALQVLSSPQKVPVGQSMSPEQERGPCGVLLPHAVSANARAMASPVKVSRSEEGLMTLLSRRVNSVWS